MLQLRLIRPCFPLQRLMWQLWMQWRAGPKSGPAPSSISGLLAFSATCLLAQEWCTFKFPSLAKLPRRA